ncbi:MAG: thiamine pyrophosphate-binding protein [Hyphomicrobiaceae bacterium]
MTVDNPRGADLLVEGLKEAGVETVFSLSGNQIMPVYDALHNSGIRIVHTRHEGAAVYMAEAAAQVTGRVGVALITAGPGFANGLSAIYTALESETPLVVLSGDSPTGRDGRGAFQELDQAAAATVMAKGSFRCRSASEFKQDVLRAIALAEAGRPGPVHLALPDDVLRQHADPGQTSVVPLPSEPPEFTDQDLEAILTVLRSAAKPLVLAGPAYCRPRMKKRLADLAQALNVPSIAFESPRGLRAPRLGAFAEVLGDADAIVTLGKPLNFMVGFADANAVAADCRIIQIDADADVLQRDRACRSDRSIAQFHAHPSAALGALESVASGNAHPANAWYREVLDAVQFRPEGWQKDAENLDAVGPFHFGMAVAPFVEQNPQSCLIIDGGEIGQWCQALLDAETAMINGPSGAIGGAIPYAIGAVVARPDQPVITIMGDGTAGFYLAEFETAVREKTPFVAIIGNDAKWNAEHQIQLRDYGPDRAHSCELTPARYDLVVSALGGHGELVTAKDDLQPAISRAFASGKPACINVMIEGQAAPTVKRA